MAASPRVCDRQAHRASVRQSYASRQRRVSLCETLDRVLNKGAVIAGDIIISVADVDLLYVGLNVVVTSVETMRNWASGAPCPSGSRPAAAASEQLAVAPEKPAVRAGTQE